MHVCINVRLKITKTVYEKRKITSPVNLNVTAMPTVMFKTLLNMEIFLCIMH